MECFEGVYNQLKRMNEVYARYHNLPQKTQMRDEIHKEMHNATDRLLKATFYPSSDETSPLLNAYYSSGNRGETSHTPATKTAQLPYCGWLAHTDIISRLFNDNTEYNRELCKRHLNYVIAYRNLLDEVCQYTKLQQQHKAKKKTVRKHKEQRDEAIDIFHTTHNELNSLLTDESCIFSPTLYYLPTRFHPNGTPMIQTSQHIIQALDTYIPLLETTYQVAELRADHVPLNTIKQLTHAFNLFKQQNDLENTISNKARGKKQSHLPHTRNNKT